MGKTHSPTQLRDNSSTMHYQNIIKSGDSWGEKKIINLGYDKLKKKKITGWVVAYSQDNKKVRNHYIISQNIIQI